MNISSESVLSRPEPNELALIRQDGSGACARSIRFRLADCSTAEAWFKVLRSVALFLVLV